MSLLLLFAIVLMAACVTVTVAAYRWRAERLRSGALAATATADEATAAVARHLRAARWLALPLAVLVSVLAYLAFDDLAIFAIPALAALSAVVCWLVAETTAPLPPPASVREASLAPRDLYEYAGRRRTFLTRASLGLAFATLAVAALLADRQGSGLEISCSAGGATTSPFPGLTYTSLTAVALVALAVMSEFAMLRIANRPDPAGAEAKPADELLRRSSAGAIVRTTMGAALVVIFGVTLTGGIGLLHLDGVCDARMQENLGYLFLTVTFASALAMAILLVDTALAAGRSAAERVRS
ncbi:hypothetical protein [Kribbella deserti]|uniref:Uncharacterized protein n=1 Tax=Kribbella deserti TaxID=1926257 RepID=A0ABV6QFA6_9ACTN